jgi:RNA polymerase sigma-70 factor, ECF subfamily
MQSSAEAEPWPLDPRPAAPESSVPHDFDEIYEKWFDEVARWIRALGGPAADRDDLVQDVFLVVYRRLPDFDGENLAGWLYQIARRRVRDFRRLLWVKQLFSRSAPVSERLRHPGADPADELEAREKGRLLERLLDTLNEEQRAAFVLFEIEGQSGEQIARIQNVPVNTVWARIHKARTKLRERLTRLDERPARRRNS